MTQGSRKLEPWAEISQRLRRYPNTLNQYLRRYPSASIDAFGVRAN